VKKPVKTNYKQGEKMINGIIIFIIPFMIIIAVVYAFDKYGENE